jgi:hypothetical protein
MAVKYSVDRFNQLQDDQQHQAILDWLSPTDYSDLQNRFFSCREEGTCKEFLNSAEYQEWLRAEKRTLFCPGIPGAGKTTITAVVIDDLASRTSKDCSVGIAYIYCCYKTKNEQTDQAMPRSLLRQLAQGLSPLPQNVKNLYADHTKSRTQLSVDQIKKTLRYMVTMYSRAFIVVDALDECQQHYRNKLLEEVFRLQASCAINLFATSRPMLDIVHKFEGHLSREVSASSEDVHKYLDGQMSQLPDFITRNAGLQEEIKETIAKSVKGMCVPLSQLSSSQC